MRRVYSLSAAKCEEFHSEVSTVVHRCQDAPNCTLCILLFCFSLALQDSVKSTHTHTLEHILPKLQPHTSTLAQQTDIKTCLTSPMKPRSMSEVVAVSCVHSDAGALHICFHTHTHTHSLNYHGSSRPTLTQHVKIVVTDALPGAGGMVRCK